MFEFTRCSISPHQWQLKRNHVRENVHKTERKVGNDQAHSRDLQSVRWRGEIQNNCGFLTLLLLRKLRHLPAGLLTHTTTSGPNGVTVVSLFLVSQVICCVKRLSPRSHDNKPKNSAGPGHIQVKHNGITGDILQLNDYKTKKKKLFIKDLNTIEQKPQALMVISDIRTQSKSSASKSQFTGM